DLDRLPSARLLAYPLIVTRRDPAASRPPSAYRLSWQGAYYQVWARDRHAPAALADTGLSGGSSEQCVLIGRLAPGAARDGARLVAATSPERVRIPLAHVRKPPGWVLRPEGLALSGPGRLSAPFALPRPGTWQLWLQGQIMPGVSVSVDGHPLGSIGG